MHASLTAVVTTLSVTTLVACAGTATGAANPSPDPARTVTAQGTFPAAPATTKTQNNTANRRRDNNIVSSE